MTDERTVSGARTTNEELQARSVRHAIELRRLADTDAARTVAFLRDTTIPRLRLELQQVLASVGEGAQPGGLISQSIEQEIARFEGIMNEAAARIADTRETELVDLGQYEARFQQSMLTRSVPTAVQQALPQVFAFDVPSLSTITRIVTASPIQGSPGREWWNSAARSWTEEAQRTVRSGIIEGRTNDEIIAEVLGRRSAPLDRSLAARMARNVEAQVRTEVNHVSTQVREAFYGENDDLIAGVIWVATLDTSTTAICRGLDGKFFDIGKGPRPPAHYSCRSTTSPVLKSLKELGLGSSDQREFPNGVRASMNGDVPEKITYYEWLKGQSKEAQIDVLGERRAALWRAGKISAEQLVDPLGRPRTIRELEALAAR